MSRKIAFLFILFLTSHLHVNAQEDHMRKIRQLKANISLLGIRANYELRLLKYSTLNLEAGIDMSVAYSSNSLLGDDYWTFGGFPTFSGEFRQYYGLVRREERGKRIDNNAGNYFSLTGGYRTLAWYSGSSGAGGGYGFIIPAWGMQRSWGKRFSFDARFGLEYAPTFSNQGVMPSIRVGFGYVIL
ncbi:hypothetical protein [Chitinophaga sp. 212800010-3]|uniref:hypothetical protein n=1 Tax=unclassified Chitinophaga TaxID=2619133 RepID=UPI002DE95BB0|nr:DUF3575 domain-containing protein [Chitinophaga sp. 212800010-3]